MIKNDFIDLHPTSKERVDAVNTLRYILLLEYELPVLDDQKDFSRDLMHQTQACCCRIFVNDNKTEIYYDFFGDALLALMGNGEVSDLAYLDRHTPDGQGNNPKGVVGFHNMILQHCILSSYHAILTELARDHNVTSYEMEKRIKGKGVHALYKEGHIKFTDDGGLEIFKDRCDRYRSGRYSGKAADLTGKTKPHIKVIADAMGLFVEDLEGPSYRYRLQFSRSCHRICGIDARRFRCLDDDVRDRKDLDGLLDAIGMLTDALEPKVDTSGKAKKQILGEFTADPVDGL